MMLRMFASFNLYLPLKQIKEDDDTLQAVFRAFNQMPLILPPDLRRGSLFVA